MHRREALSLSSFAAFAILLSGCGGKKHTKAAKHTPRQPVQTNEIGIASWYGNPYHGRQSANGEIYDMEKMTAAHRTLPFGTWVRVTNLTNGKATEVRITDRGPFVQGRIIDLSRAAARSIDLLGPGIAQVRVDVISEPAVIAVAAPTRPTPTPVPPREPLPPPLIAPGWYAVQVAALQDRDRAELMRSTFVREYGAAQIVLRDGRPQMWRVIVGRESSIEAASTLAQRLQVEVGSGFVVRLDTLASE